MRLALPHRVRGAWLCFAAACCAGLATHPTHAAQPPAQPEAQPEAQPAATPVEPPPASSKQAFFEQRVQPVLTQQCLSCHGGKRIESDLRVDSIEALRKGGVSGPAVVPHDPARSLLIQAVRYSHEDFEMPPKGKLDERVIRDLESWVRDGAFWPRGPEEAKPQDDRARLKALAAHWSFQPVLEAQPPTPAPSVSHAIDAFLEVELEREGLAPLPAADKRSLIRRVSFDLTGLPPSPAEVADYLADGSPRAFEKVVDRLLASPEYGRRWGRHWLDVARYADTSGDGTDMPLPDAWRYRNYVIDAFNRDLPYDRFLTEQLAGDILAKRDAAAGGTDRYSERVVATGFIALSRRFGNSRFADMHMVVDETLDTLGRGVLGLTLSCARCHDHKFDPVTTEDYYGLAGFFTSTQYPHAGTEHGPDPSNLPGLTPQDDAASTLLSQRADITAQLQRFEREQRKTKNPELAAKIEHARSRIKEIDALASGSNPRLAWGVSDRSPSEVGDAHVLIRGEPDRLGPKAPRGFVRVLEPASPEVPAGESGRVQLAQWVTSQANPLTARVLVNRVWALHFGKGIVESVTDFGHQGKKPSHPELLDHLARAFIAQGWSIKALHRDILLSQAYQRSSSPPTDHPGLTRDPGNRWLWRFERRRLDAESIRDAVKLIAGTLDLSDGAAHPFPDLKKSRFTQHSPFNGILASERRSVYLMTPRLIRHPYLALFDGPDTNKAAGLRDSSTVPLQALYFMNSPFIHDQARAFAQRLLREAGDDAARLRLASELAWSREPDSLEASESMAFLSAAQRAGADREAAWAAYARALLASNAMIYVD